MAFNPMQQQQSPDMLMAMMTDPRATPQQRMAAMSALNTMRGGANAPQPPQMTGDGTGVSDMNPAFMAAVRQEMMGQGPEEQPEIAQRQAAPEAPQNPSTEALMSGAADASRVAAMAQGGAVKGYAEGEEVEPTTAQRLATAYTAYNEEIDFPDLYEKLKQKVKASNEGIYNFLHGEGSYDAFDKRNYAFRNVSPSSKEKIEDKILREITAKRMAGIDPNAEPPAIPPGAPGYGGFNGPVENASSEIEMPQVNTPQFNIAPRANAALPPPPPLPPAIKPEPDPAAEAMNARKQAESDAHKERMDRLLGDKQPLSSQDKYMALLQASLGTMAAASQPGGTFLGSIGQGGMLGVEGLQKLKAARAEDRMKKMTLYGTLAGRQDASDARADALEQAKVSKGPGPALAGQVVVVTGGGSGIGGATGRLSRKPGGLCGDEGFLAQVAVRGVPVVGRAASRADHGIYRRSAFGTARLSSPTSKYSAWEKSNTEAMRLDGMDWILLL